MKRKRWIALLLSAVMLLSLVPGALAVDNSSVRITGSCPSEDAKARNNGKHFYFAEVDDPWCTTSGTAWWTCTYCGDTYEETLPALGHDFHDDWRTMYEPTCETSGLQIRFCHRCQQEETREIPALGHVWVEQTIDRIEPTCTENGHRYYTRQCSRCGMYDGATLVGTSNVMEQVLPALGHDWGDWKQETPGNCVQKEMRVRKCRRCGLEQYVYGDYGDHDWGDWHVVTPAAPGKFGLEERICKIEASHRETRDLPPLPQDTRPGLTIVWDDDTIHDASADKWYNTKEPGVLAPEDEAEPNYTVTNTGNVTLMVVGYATWDNGKDDPDSPLYIETLEPGESVSDFWDGGSLPIGKWVTPDTATDELMGTATITFWAVGLESLEDEKPLCETEHLSRTWQVAKPDADTAQLTVYLDARDYDDISVHKTQFIEDEAVFFYGEVENTGDVPLEIYDYDFAYDPGDTIFGRNLGGLRKVLQPGEKTAYVGDATWFISAGYPFNGLHLEQIKKAGPETETQIGTLTYAVRVRGYEPGTDNVLCDAEQECTVSLLKAAPEPALTLTWISDSDEDMNVYSGVEHQPDDRVWVDFEAENTGTVPLKPVLCVEYGSGVANQRGGYSVMEPEKVKDDDWGTIPISAFITPGTETAELYGTVTVTLWYDGLDPETGEKLCESNRITREWLVVKEGAGDEVHPAISVTIWADPGVGDGKRYEGAKVPYHYEVTNTGNCPVYVPWWPDINSSTVDAFAPNGHVNVDGMWFPGDEALLNPGETYSDQSIFIVGTYEVESGNCIISCYDPAWYYDTDGEIQKIVANSNDLTIPLTYPGGDPEPDNPALEIKWLTDEIHDVSADQWYYTTTPGVLEAEDGAWTYYNVINTGNVPLTVYNHATYSGGYVSPWSPKLVAKALAPGESFDDNWGHKPVSEFIAPGTDTATLLGTATVTFWATGHDPVTDEQLCETEHLSRTWEVAKPGPKPWPIPEESSLTVSIGEFDSSIDPAGYQLFEYWDTRIGVYNTGTVTVDEYTLHVDVTADKSAFVEWTNIDATDGATWYEKTFSDGIAPATVDDQYYWSPDGFVAAGDVTRGYVQASAYVTWIDPDSGKPRQSNVASVSLPVISATGLLLQKGYEKPENGSFFQRNEPIKWTLTIKNTTEEPIYNVVVKDEDLVVATFPVLNPGQEEPIAVPAHVVTDYDVDVAGWVLNQAFATGDDLQGIPHVYPSNVVKAPCNETVIPPPPPPPEDPGKKKDDPPEEPKIEVQPGDACKLTLTSMGDSEARYTLHACEEHLAAAQAAEQAVAADRVNGWQAAADIWRAEIDKLYNALREAANNDEAKAAVTADQEAYWAFIDAFAAMNGDAPAAQKALAETLRLRCAEMCCMLHTAPDQLPDSLLGDYASMMNVLAAEETSRSFGRLNGNDCDVTLTLDAELAEVNGNALAVVRGARSAYAADAFITAQAQWQMTLDSATNAAYRAADRDGKKLIAAWRQALDQVIAARREMLSALYDGHDEIIEERLMNLYRDAAIDARIAK